MKTKEVPEYVHIPPTVHCSFRLYHEDRKKLEELAAANGNKGISRYLRRIVEQHIKQEEAK